MNSKNDIVVNLNDLGSGNFKYLLNINESNSMLTIEYRKINPSQYVVVVHGIKKAAPLIFSESYHDWWKVYPVLIDKQNLKSNKYKIFPFNQSDQANKDELDDYIKQGWITTLGDLKERSYHYKQYIKGKDDNKEDIFKGKYFIDFISKKYKNSIQNNNLPDFSLWDSLKMQSISAEYHFKVNGFSNLWIIDAGYLKKKHKDAITLNADESINAAFLIEFSFQRVYIIGLIISSVTFFLIIFAIGVGFICKKRN